MPGNPVVKASKFPMRGPEGSIPSGGTRSHMGCSEAGEELKLVYILLISLKKDEHSFLILAEKKILVRKKKKTLEPCSLQWFLSGVNIDPC